MNKIGILGGKSFVGECLIAQLLDNQYFVTALTRNSDVTPSNECFDGVNQGNLTWRKIEGRAEDQPTLPGLDIGAAVSNWISVAPIWGLIEQLPLLSHFGVKRIVALSSTSKFTKVSSSNGSENILAERIDQAERELMLWSKKNDVEYIILRPTLIYGNGRDKNISEIVSFIRRFHFFPVLGEACGLRQPIHVKDVALVCSGALHKESVKNCSYNISGLETLSYRKMIEKIFISLERNPIIIKIPLSIFKVGIWAVNLFSGGKGWTSEMAERMNADLVFDTSNAVRDLDFSPMSFVLTSNDTQAERGNIVAN